MRIKIDSLLTCIDPVLLAAPVAPERPPPPAYVSVEFTTNVDDSSKILTMHLFCNIVLTLTRQLIPQLNGVWVGGVSLSPKICAILET